MLAPNGDEATVRFPVDEPEGPVGLTVTDDKFNPEVFVVKGTDVAFAEITVVVMFTGYVIVVVRSVSVTVGTMVELVVFPLLAETGTNIRVSITRRISCTRVFFTIGSPLYLFLRYEVEIR